jgi:multiple sugar transport system substrate-binding protein
MANHSRALVLVLLISVAPGALPPVSADETKTIRVIDYQPAKSAWNDFYERCSEATGYKFKRLPVPQGDIITKTVQLTAGGKGPNIVLSDGDQLPTFAAAGVVQPLDMAAIGVRAEDFVPGPYSAGTFEGKQYGLPVGSNGEIIVYNTDMLNKAGVTPPKGFVTATMACFHSMGTMAHDDLVCPPSVSACDHPARGLALSPFHAQLSGR